MIESNVLIRSADVPLQNITLIVAIINNAVQVKHSYFSTYQVAQMYELVPMEGHRM